MIQKYSSLKQAAKKSKIILFDPQSTKKFIYVDISSFSKDEIQKILSVSEDVLESGDWSSVLSPELIQKLKAHVVDTSVLRSDDGGLWTNKKTNATILSDYNSPWENFKIYEYWEDGMRPGGRLLGKTTDFEEAIKISERSND